MTESTATPWSWTSWDGATFPALRWDATLEKPRALFLAIHGLSGSAADFSPLGQYLAPLGITTFAVELRGQGNDPVLARRGDLASWSEWRRDMESIITTIRRDFPDIPIFFIGESMGGAILNRYLAEISPKDLPSGVILLAPVVTLPKPLPIWQETLIRWLLACKPKQRINLGFFLGHKKNTRVQQMTRDPTHIQKIINAPHRLESFTLRFFNQLGELVKNGHTYAPRVTAPILVLYGGKDIHFRPEQIETYFQLLGSINKELRYFPTSYHLLLHDWIATRFCSQLRIGFTATYRFRSKYELETCLPSLNPTYKTLQSIPIAQMDRAPVS